MFEQIHLIRSSFRSHLMLILAAFSKSSVVPRLTDRLVPKLVKFNDIVAMKNGDPKPSESGPFSSQPLVKRLRVSFASSSST